MLPVQLDCPVREIKTVADAMAGLRWGSQPSDVNFYFGGFPSQNPVVLAYQEKLKAAARFHESRTMRPAAGPEDLLAAPEAAPYKGFLYKAARTMASTPEWTRTVALAAFEYQVRCQVARQALAQQVQVIEQDIQARLERLRQEDSPNWAFNGFLLCGMVTVGAAPVCYRYRDRNDALNYIPKALAATAPAAPAVAGRGAAWHRGSEWVENNHAETVELAGQAGNLHCLCEALARQEREGMYTETIGGMIRIAGKDDERIKREWETASSAGEKERASQKLMEQLDRAPAGTKDEYVKAGVAKSHPLMAEILVGLCDKRNVDLQAARKAMAARVDGLVRGFANGAITRPRDLPAWMQE